MKQINKLITGMAGEYLVTGQISLRGWTANLTYKNYPGVDIIGQHPQLGENTIIQIQVKASEYPSFRVGINGKCFWQMLEESFLFLHKIIVRWKQKSLTFKNGYLLAEEVSGNPTTTRQTTP